MAMLLVESENANVLQQVMLDIVIDLVNQKNGGSTKYINQRDRDFISALDNIIHSDLFYMGRFDFIVYERNGKEDIPVLAIELDGKEHFEANVVKMRAKKKNDICNAHNLQIIRVENSYARRYNHIKDILINYFSLKM